MNNKSKLNLFERMTYALDLKGIDLWNCLYELTGESDGSLTLDDCQDSQNEFESGNDWKGFKQFGSYN